MTVDDVRMLCESDANSTLHCGEATQLVEALVAREPHEAVTTLDDQSGWLDGEHVTCIVSDVRIARASGAEGGVL